MLDLAALRERAALGPHDRTGRRRFGQRVLHELRALARAVEALLPELQTLARVASRPEASGPSVGWTLPAARGAPRVLLGTTRDALEVLFTLGRGAPADPWRAALDRRHRDDPALALSLAALRHAGASLRPRRGAGAALAETEWLQDPGPVVFPIAAQELTDPVLIARLVADRVARLGALFGDLLGIDGPLRWEPARSTVDLADALRDLRWEERALGAGAAPQGLLPTARDYVYDPVSGWFAPLTLCLRKAVPVCRWRLGQRGASAWDRAAGTPPWLHELPVAKVSAGLHEALSRWLRARGDSAAGDAAVVRVLGQVPAPDERPILDTLTRRMLEDPSGDLAAAVAGLLAGAPWPRGGAAPEPQAVARRVTARAAASAARGVATLRELGLLERDGSLEALSECLEDPALRPVLAAAVERAPAGLEVLPRGARERAEAHRARAWELSGARGAATLESVARRFCAYAAASGAVFELDLVRCVLVGLSARPFAVLTGVSGTGKTRLAQLLARFFTEALAGGAEGDREGPRVALVPVRPDWLDSRGVLGYFNALHGAGAYEDTAALRLLLRAWRHPEEPHFLILDEMNLARVEHYLAELLSAMESGEPIPLHGRPGAVRTVDGAREVPPSVPVASNLLLLGTINVDETTHPFSLKVLDRAWTWEFVPAPPTALLRAWLKERRVERPASEDERQALLHGDLPEDPVRPLVLALGRDGVGGRVDRLFEAMAACGRPFGFRVATELLRFVHHCERGGIDAPPSWHLDRAVLGKILPRLSGTRRDLEAVLEALARVCGEPPEEPPEGVREPAPERPPEALPATLAKLRELRERLVVEPFVTFAR